MSGMSDFCNLPLKKVQTSCLEYEIVQKTFFSEADDSFI